MDHESRLSKKKLRRQLWDADPHCYWCGKLTLWLDLSQGRIKKQQWKDAATIDHLYTRYEMELRKTTGNPVVLACQDCNHRRGAEATKAQPIEELWKRAGQYDRMVTEGRISA